MHATRRAFRLPSLLLLLAAGMIGGCGGILFHEGDSPSPLVGEEPVIVSEESDGVLRPLAVADSDNERWRDIADVACSADFRDDFDYFDTDEHRARVQWERRAPTLAGTLYADSLKPWFAYQMKLVGAAPIAGPTAADNEADIEARSSWRLGTVGRWWCADCGWNVPDADLTDHLDQGHDVRGYLLFDWFVTDARGNADHPFALDSSLHVLWRVGQRERGPNDTAPRWYEIHRDAGVYPAPAAGTSHQIGLFGEWEPDRPTPGEVRLPPGEYAVKLNLTEESFHANLGDDRALEGGGLWAWVLEGDLRFEVRRPVSRASCPGCMPGPHEGVGLLWRRSADRGSG